MIAYLFGVVLEKGDAWLIVNAQGVGYKVGVLSTVLSKVQVGSEVGLRVYHQVTSDHQALYGFLEAEDLQYFELLVKVPSVGPRSALNILEAAPPAVLAQAVAEDDVKVLTKVSGVGKKTAERLLVELKGKIETSTAAPKGGATSEVQAEALEALVSIGFTKQQGRDALAKLPKNVDSVETAVRFVLQGQEA